jgi:hypothetical protein
MFGIMLSNLLYPLTLVLYDPSMPVRYNNCIPLQCSPNHLSSARMWNHLLGLSYLSYHYAAYECDESGALCACNAADNTDIEKWAPCHIPIADDVEGSPCERMTFHNVHKGTLHELV